MQRNTLDQIRRPQKFFNGVGISRDASLPPARPCAMLAFMNAPPRQGTPLVPDRSAARDDAARSAARAVLAAARSTYENDRDARRLATACWPNDRMARKLVTRAASAPAMTTTAGWAQEL